MSMQQEAEIHTLLQELQRKEEGILGNENNLKKLKEETSQLRKRIAGMKSGKVRASKSMQSSIFGPISENLGLGRNLCIPLALFLVPMFISYILLLTE